jgi:hypothetical protein
MLHLVFRSLLAFSLALLAAPSALAEKRTDAGADDRAPAREPELPEPGTPGTLALTGGIITGAWYAAALGASLALPDEPWSKDARIPVVGPFLALGDMGRSDGEDTSTVLVVVRIVLAAMDGVGQVGGVGVMLESLLIPNVSAGSRDQGRATVRAAPLVGARGLLGVGVSGEF